MIEARSPGSARPALAPGTFLPGRLSNRDSNGRLRRTQGGFMATENPRTTARIGGHPIHPMLIPFPIAFLVATLACDLIFWRTGNAAWSTASLWLLGAALVMAALAAVAGLTDFIGDERIRDLSAAWHHMIGNVIVVVLALVSWYWRYTGGGTAGGPWGVGLSTIIVLLLLYKGWGGRGEGFQSPGGGGGAP